MSTALELITERVETFRASEAFYTDPTGSYKESDTRSEFIDPLLEALGWDVSNRSGVIPQLREVVREQSQEQEDAAVKFPDYTLRISGSRRMFVEAKKPSVDIQTHMESVRQARRYGYTGADPIVVLTNFRDLVIYDTTFAVDVGDSPSTGRVHVWHYREFPARLDEIRQVLGRTEAAAGNWHAQFNSTTPRQPIPADEEFVRQFNSWRLALGQDLLSQDSQLGEEDLNDAVQRILNRLIFIRMCEDRGIEGERALRDATAGGTTTVSALLNRLHRRYNTGLFDAQAAPLAARVRMPALQRIVTNLYAPNSPFSFAVLDATFLGLVYESTLAEHLTIDRSGRPAVSLNRKREYEHREVVTTPQPLVDRTVSDALASLPANITVPTTLDFAVGSGRFLVSVFDRVVQAETQRRLEAGSTGLVRTGPSEYRLSFSDKRRIVEDCLFGLDIDYNAVEVARFSLAVRLLQEENKHSLPRAAQTSILPDLSKNIVHGNSLVSSLPTGTSAAQLAVTRPLDSTSVGLPAQFDLCVGNPPYMTPERMKRFDTVELEYLRTNYRTTHKQFDKYFAFLELATDRLKAGGVLGAVVPNKWMTSVAGQKLRDLFRGAASITRLDNFREVQLFEGKSTYVCSLIAQKGGQAPFIYSEPRSLASYVAANAPSYAITAANLPVSASEPWILPTTSVEASVLSAVIAQSIPLGDVVEPKNGIQTSAERNERYLVTDPISRHRGILQWQDKFGVTNEIEESITRPFLKDSRAIRAFEAITTTCRIIFPYRQSTTTPSGWEVIDPTSLKRQYPRAHAYFLTHRAELDRRDMSARERAKAFYAYGRTQAIPYASSSPKILYSTNQRGDKYALDTTGVVYASGGTAGEVALLPTGSAYSLEFLLGFLDHPAIEFFLRKRGSVFEGGWYARGTDVIKEAPVPRLNFADPTDSQFHDDVAAAVRQLQALSAQTHTISQRNLAAHAAAIDATRQGLRALFNARWGLSSTQVHTLLT